MKDKQVPHDLMPPSNTRVFRDFRPAKNKNGKTVYVPKAMDNFLVWDLPDDYNFLEANPDIKEQVLLMVAEGMTVTKAAESLRLPFSLIVAHSCRNPEFKELLDEARRIRAEAYHDRLDNIADEVTEGTAKSAKVRMEIFKHLMTVGDRERFSPQTKTIAENSSTVTFVVDTGIRREAIPAKAEIINAEEHSPGLLGENDAGAHERLLAVDGSAEPEGVRSIQDGEAAHSTPPQLRASAWSDPARKAGTPPLRHPPVREPDPPPSGDESGERGRQDDEAEASEVSEDALL